MTRSFCGALVRLALLASMPVIAGCGDDDQTSEPARFETQLVGMMNMELLNDRTTALTWVNDARGCFAGVTAPGPQCDDLVFAGRDDWRLPTTAELSALLSAIAERGMNLNYINANCAVMTASDGYVLTENSSMPGSVTTAVPGNAGVRCVAATQ